MKNIIILLFITFFGINTFAQITETCATGTIKLKTQNHQYGTLEWQISQDGQKWDNIHDAHDTTYVFTTTKAAYYRAVNKFPTCDPIISSVTLVQRPPVANAGQDRLVNDVELYLGANSAIGSTGTWTIIQGIGGAIVNPTNPNSKFTGTIGSYTLRWTLQNSCGVSYDEVTLDFTNNQYHPKIVIVDNTDIVQSTPAQITNGDYIIQFSAPVPVIDNETILVGQVGNGYLRKVNSVTQNGNTFTMATTQGKLRDLFVDGGFELGNVFKIDSILPASRMANYNRLRRIPTRAEILSTPSLQTGKHFFVISDSISSQNNDVTMQRVTSPNTNPENPVFRFGFNNTLINELGFNVKMEGGLTFTPNVYADFKQSFFPLNTKFSLGLNNATVVNNYKFTLIHNSATPLIDREFTLFNYNRLVYFLIGTVPVIVNVTVDFNGHATADLNSNLTFVHEFQNIITTNAGIKLDNGQWTNHYSDDITTTIDNNLTLSGNLAQAFEIGPKLSFMVYGISGPYIDVKLTEDLNICAIASSAGTGSFNWKANLDLGAKLTVGVRGEILGNELFDHAMPWENRKLYSVSFPNSIEYHSGNNQQYLFNTQLPNPIKVRVMSNKGFPVPGAVVKFEPQAGGGIVSNTFVLTDLNGYAQTSWTPTGTGMSTLSAIVQDCDLNNILYSPLVFEATENAGLNCTQTTLYASYVKNGNIISPTAHMGIPPYTYSIDGTNFSSLIPQITMTTGGNYTATVRDSNGCLATMNYYNGPVTCFNSDLNLQSSVYGAIIQVSATGGNPPYLFALDNGSYSAVATFSNLSTSNHLVRVKDSNNCVRQSIITITNSTTSIVAYFSVSNNTLTTNYPIAFTNLSNNATSYLWNFGDSTTSTLTSPTHFYTTAGTYTVTLTAYNGLQQNVFMQTITISTGTNLLNIATVPIPAGTFTMGSPTTESGRGTSEVQHEVTLSAFRMSKYEITNQQFAAFLNARNIGTNGIDPNGPYPTFSYIYDGAPCIAYGSQWIPLAGCENTPVVYVSWYGAAAFAQYVGGRLPTEAEWEYAARANTTTPFNTGNCLSKTDANYQWQYPFTGCSTNGTIGFNYTQVVGGYPSNAFGLHDMHGNTNEWCYDYYGGAYSNVSVINPAGPSTGTTRINRGGSWGKEAIYCRSACRNAKNPSLNDGKTSFRIVF